MKSGELWLASVMIAIGAVALICRHPLWSKIAWPAGLAVAAVGALAGRWPAAIWLPIALAAALLGAGPARVAFFELDGVRPRRLPPAAQAAAWLCSLGAVAAVAVMLVPRMRNEVGSDLAWAACLAVAGAGVLLVIRFVLVANLADFLLGSLVASRSPQVRQGLAQVMLVATGNGRARRIHHCARLGADPTIWRVATWRYRRLERDAGAGPGGHGGGASWQYEPWTGLSGLHFVRHLRAATEPGAVPIAAAAVAGVAGGATGASRAGEAAPSPRAGWLSALALTLVLAAALGAIAALFAAALGHLGSALAAEVGALVMILTALVAGGVMAARSLLDPAPGRQIVEISALQQRPDAT